MTGGIPAAVRLIEIEVAAVKLLERNDGPTGIDDEGPDTHVLVRIEDFKALEAAVKAVATPVRAWGGGGILR